MPKSILTISQNTSNTNQKTYNRFHLAVETFTLCSNGFPNDQQSIPMFQSINECRMIQQEMSTGTGKAMPIKYENTCRKCFLETIE